MLCAVEGCKREKAASRGMCWPHYKRLMRYGSPVAGIGFHGARLAWVRDAASKDTDECLPFPWATASDVYGVVTLRPGVQTTAPRAACEIAHGPSELQALHRCRTKPCCNKKHLYWGTPLQNMQDRVRDGTDCRGEKSPVRKLTTDDVLKIRALRGVQTQARLADMFGVSQVTVADIQLRKTWRHI